MPSKALEPRTARVSLKLTATEKACIKDAAEAVEMSLTDFIVWSCLHGDQTIYAIDPKALSDIRLELSRQGNNLNQIAHAANILMHKRANDRSVEGMLDDILGMLLRLNESQHAAYAAVQALQKRVYEARLKRFLEEESSERARP